MKNVDGAGMEVIKHSISSIASSQPTSLQLICHTILQITIEEFTVEFQVQYWAPFTGSETMID